MKAGKKQPVLAVVETVPARITWQPGDDESRKQWVIRDATPEAYEAMVLQLALVIHGTRLGMKNPQKSKHFCGNDALCAESALAALGITNPATNKKK